MPEFVETTKTAHEWLQEANKLARRVAGLDAEAAWTRVKAGEWSGTPFAYDLGALMFLAHKDL